MEAPEPGPVLVGLTDDSVTVATYFDGFDWAGSALDADAMSAEAFLMALGSD